MRKVFAPITCGVMVILASLILPGASSGACAPRSAPLVTVRDAETENLIRSFANPLFHAAGVDPALVRITILQAWAIDAFVAPGNRMFIHTGSIQRSGSAAEPAGVLAHETSHIAYEVAMRIARHARARTRFRLCLEPDGHGARAARPYRLADLALAGP